MRPIVTVTVITLCALTPAFASAAAVRTLTQGTSGADVTALQERLIGKGYLSTSATGYFGPATLAAVKKFQCASGIVCSGVTYGMVGPATRGALGLGAGSVLAGRFEVSGWIPYWRAATGTADILPHLSSFTSVMPFGYVVQNDGSLHDAFALEFDTPRATSSATLLASAKSAGVKVVPTVMWSNGAAIHAILSDEAKRVALEDSIAALVTRGGFDGVDIDFEGKRAETKDYFSLFLKGLKQRLPAKLVYCAIESRIPVADRYGDATPPPDATVYANDFVAIGKYCDRVEIMAYDQQTIDAKLTKAGTEAAGPYIPISDPAWVKKVVDLAAKTIDKKKIVIGIATYGYEWQVTPMALSGFRFDMQWAFNPRYATSLAASIGVTPSRNVAGELSFIYNPKKVPSTVLTAAAAGAITSSSGSGLAIPSTTYSDESAARPSRDGTYNILWWSDAKAIAEKIALAKSLGVAGVAIFKIDGGEDQGLWSVLPKR
jgi:spore germination protein YaaH